MQRFELACKCFGLSINLKKTEVLFQLKPGSTLVSPPIMVYNQPLVYVDTFKYLESSLSTDATIDAKISCRIFKAGTAFSKLESRLQKRREIKLQTKVSVYSYLTLLYRCENWTPLKRNIHKLGSFQMRCLRRICSIQYGKIEFQIPKYFRDLICVA